MLCPWSLFPACCFIYKNKFCLTVYHEQILQQIFETVMPEFDWILTSASFWGIQNSLFKKRDKVYPAQVGCMRQALGPGALGKPRGSGWRGRWEGGSGWGPHVNLWLFHFNVWQNSLQIKKEIRYYARQTNPCFYFLNRELAWHFGAGPVGFGEHLIMGEWVQYNIDASDYAQSIPHLPQGESDCGSKQSLEARSRRIWRCREFPINPFGSPGLLTTPPTVLQDSLITW